MHITVRKSVTGSGEVLLERRSWGPLWSCMLLFTPACFWVLALSEDGLIKEYPIFAGMLLLATVFFLVSLIWFRPWRKWKLLNNKQYELEHKVCDHLDKIKLLLEEIAQVEETLDREKKEVKKCPGGVTGAYQYQVGISDIIFRRQLDVPIPSDVWKGRLSSDFYTKAKVNGKRTLNARFGVDNNIYSKGHKTAVMDSDLKAIPGLSYSAGDGEIDTTHFWTAPRRNEKKPQQNQGESQKEYQARLKKWKAENGQN